MFQLPCTKLMIPIGRRNIEAYTRAALNEVTARALVLHESSGCWVRAITLDPQVWLLVSCRERAAMLAGGGGMGEW